MILNEINGSLFQEPITGKYFAQSISSDLALGAGIALEFNSLFNIREKLQAKYPNGVRNFNGWRNCCIFEYPVFNLVVKEKHQGKPTYKTLERSLVEMKTKMEEFHIYEISMPKISTGLDKLDWTKVKKILFKVFGKTDITINVYAIGNQAFEEKKIEIYPTHIEVRPFYEGELSDYLKKLSKFDEGKRRYVPFGYMVENDILYLPRGIDGNELQTIIPRSTIMAYESDYMKCSRFDEYWMKCEPRDDLQRSLIDFLCHRDCFTRDLGYTRFVANCATGVGKTYCMVNAIITRRVKSLIICHQTKIQTQWVETFKDKTNIPEDKVVNVTSNDIILEVLKEKEEPADIYIMTHQMINSFIKSHGWDKFNDFIAIVGFGIKVFDEAHLFFENALRIDMHTNIFETFYLTATFQRSNPRENAIYKKAFAGSCRFDGTVFDSRKHIIYIPVLFNSHAPEYLTLKMSSKYGFSSIKYIQYALHADDEQTVVKLLNSMIRKTTNQSGKTLIVSPSIESSYEIANIVRNEFNRPVSVVNSKVNEEERNEALENATIISSTIKSSGTGVDIKGLRFLHCLEPHVSMNITIQLAGRLREYSATEYTYFFDYFDMSIPNMNVMYSNHMKAMKKRAFKISQISFLGG